MLVGAQLRLLRFIPAHAGNTLARLVAGSSQSVHPRTRGEHNLPIPGAKVRDGSSPHTRGTPRIRKLITYGSRFIPAHAGNTVPVTY